MDSVTVLLLCKKQLRNLRYWDHELHGAGKLDFGVAEGKSKSGRGKIWTAVRDDLAFYFGRITIIYNDNRIVRVAV
jgi:hypothetical protein